jgi:hypothetical protein
MKSISGFNSSGYGSFGEGQPISARALNRMAAGIDKAQTMFSQGVEYQANNGGVAYSVDTTSLAQISSQSIKTYEQFQIVVDGNKLSVHNGTVLWAAHNFGPDAEGNPTVTCSNQTLITIYARYTGDNVVNGTSNNGFMQEGGYVTLST